MYRQLAYTPSDVFQCANTGCIAVTKYNGAHPTSDIEDSIDVYDTKLLHVEYFDVDNPDVDISAVAAVVVTFVQSDPSKMVMISSHLHDDCNEFTDNLDDYSDVLWEFTEEFITPISYSPRPFRAFNVGDVVYRIPTDLIDFMYLPKVLPYGRKIEECIQMLLHHLGVFDVVAIIIVRSLELYRDLEYVQYCEQRPRRNTKDTSEQERALLPVPNIEPSQTITATYLPLSYVPCKILPCENTGYIAIIKHANDDFAKEYNRWGDRVFCNDDAAVEVRSPQLSQAEWSPFDDDAEVDGITSVTIELSGDPRFPNSTLTTIYNGDRVVLTGMTDSDHVFAPSATSYRTIVELVNRSPSVKSIIYRVPAELKDFIKLPKVREHIDVMVVSARVLTLHLRVHEVVTIIITLATLAHHELDYTQYCEEWIAHMSDDPEQSAD